MSRQTGAMTEEPEGLIYRPDAIDPGEEALLLGVLEGLDFRAVTFRSLRRR
jgi:hypothetical protein